MRQMHKKWMSVFFSSILLFSTFFSIMLNSVSAASDAITVAEAIANYTGSGTVEGYIVGYATGATTASFEAPFKDDINFLIADSASEQNLSNVMDVQIPAAMRTEFGLGSHPDYIGQKVRVTGSFADYNKFPGLKSVTEIELIQVETDPNVITIAAARALNDDAPAVISGVVTTPSGAYGSKGFYVQDDTAAIYINQSSVDVQPGDRVKVTGNKTTLNNEVQINAESAEGVESVVKNGTGKIPAPIELTPATVTTDVYGQVVKLSQVTVSDITYMDPSSPYTFKATSKDGASQILVYVDNHTGLTQDAVSEGLVVNVTGVVSPYEGALVIKPASVDAIIPALADGTGKKVLFDNTHGETAGAADWVIDGAFSDFADGLRDKGFTVDQLNRDLTASSALDFSKPGITLDKLEQYDVFVIGEANIPMKTSEQAAMLEYVNEGGSIFFIGDHYNSDRNLNRWDAPEIYNGYRRGAFEDPKKGMSTEEANSDAMKDVTSSDWLGQNFGIRFRFNALGDITSGETVVPPSDSFGITEGVATVEMHSGGTLAILDPTKAKGLIYMPNNSPKWSSAVDQGVYNGGGIDEGAFAAIAKVGKGKAAFIGDSSPVEDPTPGYVREDTGAKKSTFDGFLGEGQDSTFLLQTMEWLGMQEDYTDFTGKVTLSDVTPLLHTASLDEDPEKTTEPQTEPWSNPPAGYKWYDSTTFKAGAYGSGVEPPKPVEVPGITSISGARTYSADTTLTVEGTVTSKPGIWGGKAFYLQDSTGGIYIYSTSGTVNLGDHVKVTGDITVYNSELEITNIKDMTVTGTDTLPEPQVVTSLNDDNQGQLVTLKNVTISDIEKKDDYGTLEFNATNGNVTTLVRIDNRTGVTYDSFTAQYHENDVLDLTGVSSIFNGVYQLKPREIADINVASGGTPEDPSEQPGGFLVGKPVFTNLAGQAVTKLTPNGFIKTGVVLTNQTSEDKQASLIIALYDASGSVKNISYVEKLISAGKAETLNAGFGLPNQVNGYTVKVFVWDSFSSMHPLSGGVVFPE